MPNAHKGTLGPRRSLQATAKGALKGTRRGSLRCWTRLLDISKPGFCSAEYIGVNRASNRVLLGVQIVLVSGFVSSEDSILNIINREGMTVHVQPSMTTDQQQL